jgi:hypothetical protein
MEGRIILAIIVIVIIICVIQQNVKKDEDDHLLSEIDRRLLHTLKTAGYNSTYSIKAHRSRSFTRNKKDINICTECISGDKTELDRVLYLALHEAAHTITHTKDHTEHWKNILKTLLHTAADLHYLDPSKIKI